MSKKLSVLLLLSLLIGICYSNTITSSWHLDDEPNILTNQKLHLTSLTPQALAATLAANPTKPESSKLYRPVPCLTLALNWYWSKDNTLSYHLVNITIHIITSFLLFLTTLQLLQLINPSKSQNRKNYFIALLATCLWATAPIQTQAVTYIIQRMAAMAAMFTLLAIYSYLKGRTNRSTCKYLWFTLCLLSFFAALGSKENAILLPFSLFLIELTFFQYRISRKQIIWFSLGGSVVLFLGLLFVRFGLGLHPFDFLNGYGNRSFTFSERTLTEPRIVLMYLSQTILPLANRLSIDHDIILSTSLFSPWSTLPAILCILTLVILSVYYLKRYPLFTFPILFFFLNHLVESTVIPLELIFEHRNYLPSFFIFLPMSYLIARVVYGPGQFSLVGRSAIILFATVFLIISGHATYTRNFAWANEDTLWTDAINKAPTSSRAAHNLGRWYRQFGKYEIAGHYFQLALRNADRAANSKMTRRAALNGMASVSYMLGRYEQSLQYFNQCLEYDKNDEACLKNRTLAFLQLGLLENAESDALRLTDRYPVSPEYHYLAAISSYKTGRIGTAQKEIEKITARSLDNHQVMYLTGLLLLRQQAYPNSLFFLKRAHNLMLHNIDYHLTFAGALYLNEDYLLAEKMLDDIIKIYSLQRIQTGLHNIKQNWPDTKTITFLKKQLNSHINKFTLPEND